MKRYNFPIIIEQDEDGYFALCPTLQGCYTQGNTYEEVVENMKDAIKIHVEDRQATQEIIDHKELVSLSMVEVTA